MTHSDRVFADTVRAQAGWNQTPADWERFLTYEPEGCFVAEWNGALAGTATTTSYGSELAWIGMVLVAQEHRRQGIGRALLLHCIDYLRGRKVGCIKLDATPEGQKIYELLGFKAEWTLSRWQSAGERKLAAREAGSPRCWTETDRPLIEELDRKAFGVSRRELLSALAQFGSRAVVVEPSTDPVRNGGFGFIRPGARACYLGPMVTAEKGTGLQLVNALLATPDANPGVPVYWDIPDANGPVVEYARHLGFTKQRSLTRMYLGENKAAGRPELLWAIAGPEVG